MRLRCSSATVGICAVAFVCILVVYFLWRYMFTTNPQYTLQNLEIQTGLVLPESRIIQIADGRLDKGRSNLFAFSAKRLREDFVETSPNIAEVEISKKLPDTIRIVVREREPLVQIMDRSVVLDETGLVFTLLQADRARYSYLPKIENGRSVNSLNFEPGTQVKDVPGVPKGEESRMVRCLSILKDLRRRENVPFQIVSMDIDKNSIYLTIQTRDYISIKIPWEELAEESVITKILDRIVAIYANTHQNGYRTMIVVDDTITTSKDYR